MCDDCGWEDQVEEIQNAVNSGAYDWCEDTLIGILDWVEANGHITDRQCDALENMIG